MDAIQKLSVIVHRRKQAQRVIARLDASGDDIEWITVNGTHIPLKDGKAVGGPEELRGQNFTQSESTSESGKPDYYRPHHSGGDVSNQAKFRNRFVSDEDRAQTRKDVQTYLKGWMYNFDGDRKSCVALGKYLNDTISERFKLRKKNKDLDAGISNPQVEDIYDVLRDVRDFGAPKSFEEKYEVNSDISGEDTSKILKEAFDRYPTDWYNNLDDYGGKVKIRIIDSPGRACYNELSNSIVIFAREDDWLGKNPDGTNKKTGNRRLANELVHEMGHYMEAHNSVIRSMAQRVLEERTKDSENEPLEPGYETKPDKFFTTYMGKQYYWGDTEITSCLMEHLGYIDPANVMRGKTGCWLPDPESYKFILGMLIGTERW